MTVNVYPIRVEHDEYRYLADPPVEDTYDWDALIDSIENEENE